MYLFAWLLLMPLLPPQASSHEAPQQRAAWNEDDRITIGEPVSGRTIFVVISLFWMWFLSLLLGTRLSRIKRNILMRRNFMSGLVSILYVVVLVYIMVAAVMVSGQGMFNYGQCVAGTFICLTFYCMAKAIMYTFLVERVHIVRAPYVNRRNDKIYLACMAMILVLYSAVIINSYIHPVHRMDLDGRCHFGVTYEAAIPVISVNVFTDVVLTGIFFYLLFPVVKDRGIATVSGILRPSKNASSLAQSDRNETAVQRTIRALLWKSIIGGFLIEIPTAANMIQFLITRGDELGMVCLTICMVDVCWDTVILHWLTFGSSAAAERELSRQTQRSGRTPLTGEVKGGFPSFTEANDEPTAPQIAPQAAMLVDRGRCMDSEADAITALPQRQYDKA